MNALAPTFAREIADTFTPADFADEGRAARIAARRHIASLPAERRAQLERDWLDGEAAAVPAPVIYSPERWAELQALWDGEP